MRLENWYKPKKNYRTSDDNLNTNGKGDYKQFDNMTEWNTRKRMSGNDWINTVCRPLKA